MNELAQKMISGNAEERRNSIRNRWSRRAWKTMCCASIAAEKIFCAVNLGQREQKIAIPAGADIFIKSKKAQQFENKVILPKFGFAAFQRKEKE